MLGSAGRQQHRASEHHDGRRLLNEEPVEGADTTQGEAHRVTAWTSLTRGKRVVVFL